MTAALAPLLAPLSIWFSLVNQTVTEPYLDEVFHVRQAQNYCNGRFDVWDPKITTPPGLYLLSYAFSQLASVLAPLFGHQAQLASQYCSLGALRAGNVVGLVALVLIVRQAYILRSKTREPPQSTAFDHSALNVALFPPLFFFSSLYYTDVWSTAFVLAFYVLLPNSFRQGRPQSARFVGLFCLGLATLFFRQTNIFWAAIFPAGIVLVQQLDRGHPAVRNSMYRKAEGFGDSFYSVAKTSWKMDVIYDPPLSDADTNDFVKMLVSIGACTAKLVINPTQLFRTITALMPFISLLGLFAAFVLINGGVVLGDKSNHIATLHLPQMLYLWPFVVFFSWPLLYPYLLLVPMQLLSWLPIAFNNLEALQIFKRRRLLPRLSLLMLGIGLACLAVYTNTIVHPFTLADNRHYVFYVFRYLLRPWWIRYAVTPVYVLCGWACIQTLGAGPAKSRSFERTDPQGTQPLALPDGQNSPKASFALIWIVTCTLQLVTAPLVEPRYFILPWIFWRIHVPLRLLPTGDVAHDRARARRKFTHQWDNYDHRLWFETVWMLLINVVTGYMFLYRGFSWPQEPGQVQRFMW